MAVTLSDKYRLNEGRALITGTQALTRILISQRRSDHVKGLNTAGYISGYRGSPLGALDTALWSARDILSENGLRFEAGVNEELAATAVYGTQQVGFFPGAKYDGVFAAWYGKGPGVDRAGDALKHGNLSGTSPLGGVLVFAGDDHTAKSSTTAHQSEQALSASLIPVLYPASPAELLKFGSFGYALSRFSGLWVGFKCVNDTADATATVDLQVGNTNWILPEVESPPQGLNILRGETQLSMEKRTVDFRLPAAQAFIRANGLDVIMRDSRRRTLGIVTAGRAALDVVEAMNLLGLGAEQCRALGIRVLKLAMTWPADPETIRDFAQGHDELLIVEDKRAFIEPQVASILYHLPTDARPRLAGKAVASGRPLLAQTGELTPTAVAVALFDRMSALGLDDEALRARRAEVQTRLSSSGEAVAEVARTPFYCSGCPHNRSTSIPEGGIALSGIGCHVMAAMMPHRQHMWPVQMGGEGANWIGAAPFTDTPHVFQNLGDGTYHHSGSLAIRAAIASGVNVTYKLLFNDAVAMTGGQPVEGQQTPWQISKALLAEGVRQVVVVADDPSRYPSNISFPEGVKIRPRDDMEHVQRELAAQPGVTVLLYDQVCAAEKRRRRKKGQLADPTKRLFINDLVCEGCGDCSVKSNCVSVQPLETEYGRKRKIDQSSCNKDYSCAEGFCPSFVTVEGGEIASVAIPDALAVPELPLPVECAEMTRSILIAGIGGTGVVTIGAILAMAAHIEGKAASVVDVTGLSQKNGAVFSHLRIASTDADIAAARIPAMGADVVLACDMIAAGSAEAVGMMRPELTSAVVNKNVTPTAGFTINTGIDFAEARTTERFRALVHADSIFMDATRIAQERLGDTIGTNLMIVGAALQRGFLPVSVKAVEEAIRLNGVAVSFNLRALELGRLAAIDPAAFEVQSQTPAAAEEPSSCRLSQSLAERIDRRKVFLGEYQNENYAARFTRRIKAIGIAEQNAVPGETALLETVVSNLFKLMAIKDEYEVARLYTSEEFRAKLSSQFSGRYRLSIHLAPPFLAHTDSAGMPKKRQFGPWVFTLFHVLTKLRWLRGTPFDLFGRTHERRLERQLLKDYEEILDEIERDLRLENHAAAVALARYPERIRGFGHVKLRSLPLAESDRDRWMAVFRSAAIQRDAKQNAASFT